MTSRKSQKSRKSRRSRRSRRSKVILPKPQKGALGDYSTKYPVKRRHKVLRADVKKLGYKTTVLDLSERATLNKRRAPSASKKMRADIKYLQKSRKSRRSRTSKK